MQSPQTQNIADGSFVGYVENELVCSPDLVTSAAARSLLSSLRGARLLDADALRVWIASMVLAGLKPATCRRYFGRLRSLHACWLKDSLTAPADLPAPDPFAAVAGDLKAIEGQAAPLGPKTVAQTLARARALVVSLRADEDRVMASIALYLLLDPCASVADAVRLRFSDSLHGVAQLEEVVAGMRRDANAAKYVFPLMQGRQRDAAVAREVIAGVSALLRRLGAVGEGEPFLDRLHSLWTAAAVSADIPLCKIKAVLNPPPPSMEYFWHNSSGHALGRR